MSVIISLDFGVKKMGMAVGNSAVGTAQPLTILPMDNGKPDWQVLFEHITSWQASTIIIGLPLNMDGSESHLSKRAFKFGKRLNHKLKEQHIGCSVYMVDERLTSKEATAHNTPRKTTKKTQFIDDKAACILLESWLNETQGIKL